MIHRCHYSPFAKGEYGTVYSFVRTFRSTIDTFKPDKVIVVTEGNPKFRYEIYPEYKAQRFLKRAELPQEEIDHFKIQKHKIHDLIKLFPVEFIKHPDYECDDVIATLVKKVYHNDDCVIVSGDNDYLQLVNDNVKLYNPIKKQFIPKPDYDILLMKALAGDVSDNIKGLPRVGEKTALKIISDKKLFEEKTSEYSELFQKNLKLVTFADVPISEIVSLHEIYNQDKIRVLFKELAFNSYETDGAWEKFIKVFQKLNQ